MINVEEAASELDDDMITLFNDLAAMSGKSGKQFLKEAILNMVGQSETCEVTVTDDGEEEFPVFLSATLFRSTEDIAEAKGITIEETLTRALTLYQKHVG